MSDPASKLLGLLFLESCDRVMYGRKIETIRYVEELIRSLRQDFERKERIIFALWSTLKLENMELI